MESYKSNRCYASNNQSLSCFLSEMCPELHTFSPSLMHRYLHSLLATLSEGSSSTTATILSPWSSHSTTAPSAWPSTVYSSASYHAAPPLTCATARSSSLAALFLFLYIQSMPARQSQSLKFKKVEYFRSLA